MRQLYVILFTLLVTATAMAVEPTQTIVSINGVKYRIHTVQEGDTLYAIARCYGVDEQAIRQCNPGMTDVLKVKSNLKIPITEKVQESPQERPKLDPKTERKLRKTFELHHVIAGETFYAISRRYEIPVKSLIADNPNVDPAHLQVGSIVLVRKKQIGTEDAQGSQTAWEALQEAQSAKVDSTAEPVYHIVAKGDTFYSLARKYGITEEELSTLNEGLQASELKKGAVIRVSATPAVQPTEEFLNPNDSVAITTTPDRKRQIFLQALRSNEPLKIAMMLPLEVQGKVNSNYLEFYQGFLLGLDSVKSRYGRSVDLTLYNTARDEAHVQEILTQESFEGSRLIIGPVYEHVLEPVVRYAEEHEVPIVSPLAHLSEEKSDILFQMAPAPQYKYDKVQDFFAEERAITLIYSGATDQEFEREIKAQIGEREVRKFDFLYVQGDAKKLANSAGDLTPLLENHDDNVFIIMAESEVDIERILAALASADTNIRARGLTPPRFSVLGNARWNRYNNLDRSVFFKDRVTFVSTYHAKRDAQIIQDFDSSYIRAFGSLPTLYAYRGFDTAMIFVPAMYNDIEYDMEGRSFKPLQTTYIFEQPDHETNHINTTWMRVNYRSDFTIEIE